MQSLQAAGATINAYDPIARHEAEQLFGHDRITYCEDLGQAITDVDAIVILTRWEDFKRLPDMLTGLSPQPLVIDGRRMLDKHSVARYEGIGL